jgi:hypothetical protein
MSDSVQRRMGTLMTRIGLMCTDKRINADDRYADDRNADDTDLDGLTLIIKCR